MGVSQGLLYVRSVVEHALLKRDAGLTVLGGMCVVQICLMHNRLCHSGTLFGLVFATLTCKAACFFLGRMLMIWATEKHYLQQCLALFCCETGYDVSQAGLAGFSCHHSGLCGTGDQTLATCMIRQQATSCTTPSCLKRKE